MARGGTIVLAAKTGIAALLGLWRDTAELQINVIDCVPTAIQSILSLRQSPAASDHRPRLFISGGAPISSTTILAFESRYGVPLLQEYGLSEAVCVSACERPSARKLGSVGKPLPGTDIRIMRADGSQACPGERGRVYIRSPSMMSHYEGGAVQIPPPFEDGYLTTNDIGLIDDEGFLFIFGRLDDTLIKGGANIVPTDVEALLAGYPGLVSCAVMGVPCDTYGIDLVVFYVQGPGPPIVAAELKAYLRDRGERMWYPRAVIRVDSLPMTSSGKVLRGELCGLLPANDSGRGRENVEDSATG
jgi:long-chain acyl-CoA synthetase